MFTRFTTRLLRNYGSKSNASGLAETIAASFEGVNAAGINELLTAVPELNKYTAEQWHRTAELLTTEGLEAEKILSIIGGHPSILARPLEKLAESLHCWRSCQFGDANMKVLVAAHPILLEYTNHGQLAQRVAYLHSHFETRKNVYRLFLAAPNLLVDEQRVTEAKIVYLMEDMRHDVLDVVKSYVFSHDLDHLRCRHTFLERLGLFKPRSLKADKTMPTSNPPLHQITDTTDKRFAVKVAYVTLEEYEVFQELFRREGGHGDWAEEQFEDGHETTDDDEIEPSRDSYRKGGR